MNSQERSKIIVRTSMVGIVANVLLSVFKAAVGLLSNSIAVVLDAVNNLTDALSSVITIIGAKLAERKPDREHPLGHGRYEYLATLIIILIVLYAGISSLVQSVDKILNPDQPDYSTVAIIIISAAIVVKLVLGRYVSAKGRQCESGSLIASGKDALFDAAISASVLAAAIIFMLTGISLEAYVGLGIAIVIIKAGIDMLRDALNDILGSRPSSELSTGIKKTVCEDPDVLGVYDLLLEDYGPNLVVASLHVEVADTMTATDIDLMTRRLQEKVSEEHHVMLGTVGIYSHNTTDPVIAEMQAEITRIVMSYEGVLQMHGFFVNTKERYVSFDVIIDFDTPDRMTVFDTIKEEVCARYPDYEFRIVLDRDLSD